MGNICRSPTAEGIFAKQLETRKILHQFSIDSAGTGDWHVGNPPDERAQAAAKARGVDLSGLRARQISANDLDDFDWVIVMDEDNEARVRALAKTDQLDKIQLLMHYSNAYDQIAVPDPYYGGEDGFDTALDMIEAGCSGLIDALTAGDRQ